MGRATELELNIREAVGAEVSLFPNGLNSYRVLTPFTFDDGDNYAIVLNEDKGKWTLTDEGHTLMHMSYDMDERELQKGTRAKIVEGILGRHGVKEEDGALVLSSELDALGFAVFDYIKAITHLTDIKYLSREVIRSTFFEDFKDIISKNVPAERMVFGWHHPNHDPKGMYSVDCRVNKMERPLMIFAVNNDDKARDATITVLQFEKWNMKFNPIAIFEDQEIIQRSVLARLSNVFGKQFASISSNEGRITEYLHELVGS